MPGAALLYLTHLSIFFSTLFRIKIMLADKVDQCKIQIEFLSTSLSSVNTVSVAQAADNSIAYYFVYFQQNKECVFALLTFLTFLIYLRVQIFYIILRYLSQFLLFLFSFFLCVLPPPVILFCICFLKLEFLGTSLFKDISIFSCALSLFLTGIIYNFIVRIQFFKRFASTHESSSCLSCQA